MHYHITTTVNGGLVNLDIARLSLTSHGGHQIEILLDRSRLLVPHFYLFLPLLPLAEPLFLVLLLLYLPLILAVLPLLNLLRPAELERRLP